MLQRPFIAASRSLSPLSDTKLLPILNRYAVRSGILSANGKKYLLGITDADAIFRTASVTKLVTAIGVMKFVEDANIDLDAPVASYSRLKLKSCTLRQLLSHTSGLVDGTAYIRALSEKTALDRILSDASVWGNQGEFAYSNLGFGIIGSLVEDITGESIELIMRETFFDKLELKCSYDITRFGSVLDSFRIVPPSIKPAFSFHARNAYAMPLSVADPMHHYTLCAGNLYTNVETLDKVLQLLVHDGDGFLSTQTVQTMKTPHGHYGTRSPYLSYGLGLLIINDSRIADETLYGHQGVAYGAVNAAFFGEKTKRTLVSLTTGASEQREQHLVLLNRDLLKWEFQAR